MWEYKNPDELYHYGVLGMRWGYRKDKNIQKAYNKYKEAVAGAELNGTRSAFDKREKAAFNLIDAKAKYAYDKKLNKKYLFPKSKEKRLQKAKKAMENIYNSAGRDNDYEGFGQDQRYEKHMAKKIGKAAVYRMRNDKATDEMIEYGAEIYSAINRYRDSRDAYRYRKEQREKNNK